MYFERCDGRFPGARCIPGDALVPAGVGLSRVLNHKTAAVYQVHSIGKFTKFNDYQEWHVYVRLILKL